MRTVVTRSAEVAAAYLRAGEVVAFPTETVYGLGADVFNAEAVRKVFAAKERPPDNPLIAHVAAVEDVDRVARTVSPVARAFMDAFFPGPLTLVLPKRPQVPSIATAGLDSIGVRMPRHPAARSFLAACRTVVAAPSANRSGRPSPTTWEAVREDLDGRIACILRGDPTEVGLESTVVDCTATVPTVLRSGAVTVEALRAVAPETVIAAPDDPTAARSPGTRHRHYAPRARVHVVERAKAARGGPGVCFIGLDHPDDRQAFLRCLVEPDLAAYARDLYAFFRECDEAGATSILCEAVRPEGLGLAILDRITRAASR